MDYLQTLSRWAKWISDMRDTDPSVLADQSKLDLRAANEILASTNRLLDSVDRSTDLQGLIASLYLSEDKTQLRIFEQPEGFHHVALGIVTKNFLCGLSKDDFSGPGASLTREYADSLTMFLNISLCYLYRVLTLWPSPLLQRTAQYTLEELNPVWGRLTQLVPPSSWRDFEPGTDLDSTPITIPSMCAATMGFAILITHLILRRFASPPALNTQLIVHIIHAFCLGMPNLNPQDFQEIMNHQLSGSFAQERHAILTQAFCDETMAGMFFRAYCDRLTSGIDRVPGPTWADDSPSREESNLHIAEFLDLAVSTGPEPLIRVLSAPGALETLISYTLQACQYSRCTGGSEGSNEFARPFMFTIHAITLPVFKHNHSLRHLFALDVRTSYLLVSYCTLALSAELRSSAAYAEALLDCIAIYALPCMIGNISPLPASCQYDIHTLRNILAVRLAEVNVRLERMQQTLPLRRRATLIMRQISDGILSDDVSTFPNYYPGRRRCSCFTCECSGVKPLHRLRICKGCFLVFYCSKRCQKYDWDNGKHKEFCQQIASRESGS